ncbi:MAG: hypothetical protein QNJ72_22415 [Pleurocapsa sp. MO_226.B13]|nr:hypothetical protein [Pleurocapsa sp. MO_226.B13]
MATNFITGFSSKLAESWIASLLTPAFVFWAGGVATWVHQLNEQQRTEWSNWLINLSDVWTIALLVGSLLVVVSSGAIVQRLDFPVLRFLEGYWPRWLRPLWLWLVKCQRSQLRRDRWRIACLDKKQAEELTSDELERFWSSYWPQWLRPFRAWLRPLRDRWITRKKSKLRKLVKCYQFLVQKQVGGVTALTAEEFDKYESLDVWRQAAKHKRRGLTLKEEEEYARLDWRLRQAPADYNRFLMPTRLGNLLRAAETRPYDKYRLDAVTCWSRLWLVLPESAQKELTEARAELNLGARFWLWSLLFLIWSIWTWWAIPIGLLSALLVYRWMLSAATNYGELIEAAFDIYRFELYKSLHWPLPTDSDNERQKGLEITQYLLGNLRRIKFEEKGEDV